MSVTLTNDENYTIIKVVWVFTIKRSGKCTGEKIIDKNANVDFLVNLIMIINGRI